MLALRQISSPNLHVERGSTVVLSMADAPASSVGVLVVAADATGWQVTLPLACALAERVWHKPELDVLAFSPAAVGEHRVLLSRAVVTDVQEDGVGLHCRLVHIGVPAEASLEGQWVPRT